ncbi:MAG: spore coat associated protein CotJA [Eubacteriales bacterium]
MAEINDHEFIPMVPFMPKNPMYAHAYVPYQINFKIVDPNEAMEMGTIFPDLYSPWKEGSLW